MMATSASTSRAPATPARRAKSWTLMYSHEVPKPKVPAPKQNPLQAARRGLLPSHSHISTAGHRIASGHSSAARTRKPAARRRRARARDQSDASGGALTRAGAAGSNFRRNRHAQAVDATPIGAHDAKLELAERHALTTSRHAAELFHDQSGHGIEFALRQLGVENTG